MAYKILYIEDLQPGSIVHELQANGFEAEHYNPESLEELLQKVVGFDLLLLDFRLTESKKIIFDAPTIAQTIRTVGGSVHMDIPIVLISTEKNICDYFRDYSSQDLFDYSVSKEIFLENIKKYTTRFIDVIEAYKKVIENKGDLSKTLALKTDEMQNIDYRVVEKLSSEIFADNVFAYNNFILNHIIRSTGILVGEDVLSARLGVSMDSPDWENLKAKLIDFKYSGIYSNAYERWWSFKLDHWWEEMNKGISLRRLNATQRVQKLIGNTDLQSLIPQEKLAHSSSSNFWTICKDSKMPIDSLDGLELHQRDLFPWQEKEYISIKAGLESSDLSKYIKQSDKARLREIMKQLEV